MIPIQKLIDEYVKGYFESKATLLVYALEIGEFHTPCDDRECWEGARCKSYCEVADFCIKGLLHQGG